MYFKKLELLGFKSFAEKTTLHFEPGITAVVGPNGCGKSNIFDSIRWVLGEQSVKSLRGSKMEDIIFNGTETIPALGYAEVSLTFSNETRALPIEYDEVTVTRRLFRSGESEYLINKTQVRLKDIQELFMGTGIGAESYSLIEQGKIDLILSSRPEDRRLVFDEASGISKYKSQKREAARKLEDTENNLLRINDIIIEVKRQINSLERQAAKARRYKEVLEKLKALETDLAAFQIKQYQEELTKLTTEKGALSVKEAGLASALEQADEELSIKQKELLEKETCLNYLERRQNEIENIILRNSHQVSLNDERSLELESRLKAIELQKQELSLKILADQEKVDGFKAIFESLDKELQDKKTLQSKVDSELQSINNSITRTQGNIKQAKEKILGFAAQEAALDNHIQDVTNQLHQTIAHKKRLDIEKYKAEEELTVTKRNLDSSNQILEEMYARFSSQEKEVSALRIRNSLALEEKEKARAMLVSYENEKLTMQSQLEFLNNLKLKYENITESANATVLLDSLSDVKITGMLIKVNAVEENKDNKWGDNIKFKATGIAKPISLNPEEIVSKIEEFSLKIIELKEALAKKEGEIGALSAQIQSSDDILRDMEIEYSSQKAQRDNISGVFIKLKDETDIVLSEVKDTDIELGEFKEKEKLLSAELVTLKNSMQSNQVTIESWLTEAAFKAADREKVLLESTQLKVEINAHAEKASGAQGTYRMYEEALHKEKQEQDALLIEEANSISRVQELKEAISKLDCETADCHKQKEIVAVELKATNDILSKVSSVIDGLRISLRRDKEELDGIKSRVYQLSMRIQELNFSTSSIHERMSQVYKLDITDVSQFFKPDLKVDEVITEIQQFKDKIESYGQVNLVAIDEFDELKKRFDFLNTQHEDLIKSKESLHEAILKINRTCRKMFLDTFEKLAVEFKNYFRLLFGGGDAQLYLVDEQDVLESGIEIACRPPGKKLQNVLLLSGGEKAMSAIALLFAIFKVKPSPFCVLDEIDAALDEANVDRFSRTLVDFTTQSQFIVITHNKKTIANANVMYGITMEKAGISKIVSVKLADNKKSEQTLEAQTSIQGQPALKEEPVEDIPVRPRINLESEVATGQP